ncbi:hypothetical protein K4F52_009761 [Lecanicillium sp. MT-2017a]|nr:hypothetical protein K4F52_009761 [Lecanicillium sp. MT-2017a]
MAMEEWLRILHTGDMSDLAAKISQEIRDSTDAAQVDKTYFQQVVDRIWAILNSDHRYRSELIKKIQSTPGVTTLATPISTPSAASEHTTPSPTPRGGAELPDEPPSPLPETDDSDSANNEEVEVATSLGVDPPTLHSRRSLRTHSSAVSYAMGAAGTISGKRRRTRGHKIVEPTMQDDRPSMLSCGAAEGKLGATAEHEQPSPEEAGIVKRRRLNEDTQELRRLVSPPLKRHPPSIKCKFRGRGKKQKTPAPDFNDRRFTRINETLRREISVATPLQGLQSAWRLANALATKAIPQININPSDSRIKQLQCRIEYCDELRVKGNSLSTRAVIEQRFYMVQLMAEYRKAKQAGTAADDVAAAFQEELFPDKEQRHRRSTWDYYSRVGVTLLNAVERYGYGVLLYPLGKVTKKSLHLLKRESIDDLLDYMESCHPGLNAMLLNVSYVLPRLLTWGIPKTGLEVINVPFDDLLRMKDDPFNNLFPIPASVVNGEKGFLLYVPPWSLHVDEEEENKPRVLEDGSSYGHTAATCTTPNGQNFRRISFDFE